MKKIIIVAGVVLSVAACDNAQGRTTLDISQITHSQDSPTGLCVGLVGGSDNTLGVQADSLSFTHVPCTRQVMAQIGPGV